MKSDSRQSMNRRDFLKTSATAAAAFTALGRTVGAGPAPSPVQSTVSLIKTTDRAQGVKDAIRLLQIPGLEGRAVMIKPNFNTADPAPGSTHNDTLRQLVLELKSRGAGPITLGESSGPPQTKKVLEDKGIPALARELGFDILNFEELSADGWVHFAPAGTHWQDGFSLPRAVVESPFMVSTCCLKTHGYGGHFSMSMKLAVGLTPKSIRRELHGKRDTDMRAMIAELNQGYRPRLIVMDGVDAFVDGGPSTGKKVEAGVFIGGTDRVAVDAVGVAVLKELGSNATLMSKKVFDQDQIRRAVEIGLGVASPAQIEIVSSDAAGRAYAGRILEILKEG